MRYLILSDIHSNWEALEAVIAEASGQYGEILCCGDLIGYGADPNLVVEWARSSLSGTVRGNHDKAAVGLENLEWFNPVARVSAQWTHKVLTPENAEYIRALPKGPLTINGFDMAHGSPLDEDEYLVAPEDAGSAFSYLGSAVTFIGHTHLQGGFLRRAGRVATIGALGPKREQFTLSLEDQHLYLLNPGSVGQPRDGDPRAAYALYDADLKQLTYHRLAYDMKKAQDKIRSAGLPDLLAERLAWGR